MLVSCNGVVGMDRRRQRDVDELLTHRFSSPQSEVVCRHVSGIGPDVTVIEFCITVFYGPYRGGHFIFKIEVGAMYPYLQPVIVSAHPLWHPNIDVLTGALQLPVMWSPICSLIWLVTAARDVLLLPNVEFHNNGVAAKSYTDNIQLFEVEVQLTLMGGVFRGVYFPPCRGGCYFCSTGDYLQASRKRQRENESHSHVHMGEHGHRIHSTACIEIFSSSDNEECSQIIKKIKEAL